MKILQCHNFYRQPGGEEQVFHDEARLLELHGHKVVRFTRHSDAIREMSPWRAASQTIWNRQASAELRRLIRRERPAIAHFTNTFPLISPAAYYVARSEGVKIVQSLHNYRLVCPNSLLLRDAKPCEDLCGEAGFVVCRALRLLSQQSPRDRRRDRHARLSSRDWNLEPPRRCLLRNERVCQAEVHRGWTSCPQDLRQTELRLRRLRTRQGIGWLWRLYRCASPWKKESTRS